MLSLQWLVYETCASLIEIFPPDACCNEFQYLPRRLEGASGVFSMSAVLGLEEMPLIAISSLKHISEFRLTQAFFGDKKFKYPPKIKHVSEPSDVANKKNQERKNKITTVISSSIKFQILRETQERNNFTQFPNFYQR